MENLFEISKLLKKKVINKVFKVENFVFLNRACVACRMLFWKTLQLCIDVLVFYLPEI